MYQAIAHEGSFDLEVWYCSAHGLKGEVDKQFGMSVKWDIPILDGYKYIFLNNFLFKPSIYGFWGLFNLGIIMRLAQQPKDSIVIVPGWGYFTYLLSIICAKILGLSVGLRSEATLYKELHSKKINKAIKHLFLGKILFKIVDYFFYIGVQNRAFYQHYGVHDNQLIFSPYAVDNRRFQQDASVLLPQKDQLRQQISLPQDAFIVLYSGKLIHKKHPFDLLQAIALTKSSHICAVFMGDGELKKEIQHYITENNLEGRVFLTGFINQSVISYYYAAADAYVMCSDIGETWGLSTNEAMNFGLPVLLSDQVGCNLDLLHENKNGYIFTCGNVEELAQKIDTLALKTKRELDLMGQASLQTVQNYSYQASIDNIKQALS